MRSSVEHGIRVLDRFNCAESQEADGPPPDGSTACAGFHKFRKMPPIVDAFCTRCAAVAAIESMRFAMRRPPRCSCGGIMILYRKSRPPIP